LAIAKSLSLQIFEKNVGDESLFHALVKAYDLSISKDFSVTKLEEALWNALAIGLDRFAGKGDDHLMIVIDGLDELKNHDNVKSVMEYMGLLTSKHGRLQAVTLSRTSPKKPGRGKIQPFQIKPDYTREDLRHIAEHALEDYVHYKNLGGHAREIIVEKLIHTAHGNFLVTFDNLSPQKGIVLRCV